MSASSRHPVSASSVGTRSRLALLWPVLGVATLLTYNTWVLWKPVNGNAGIFDGYLSELSASDQPHNFFFRGGDLITAAILLVLGSRALVLWRRHRPVRPRWWLVAAAALVLFGLSTFFDAFFAMDCSPTLSELCKVAEETGRLSTIHYAHTYTSVGAQIGIVASMVAAWIAMQRSLAGSVRVRRTLLAVCVIEVVALSVMMAMLAAGVPGLGYPQAVMVLMASIWFAGAGFGLAAVERHDGAVERATESTRAHEGAQR